MLPSKTLVGGALAIVAALLVLLGVQSWRLVAEQRDHGETRRTHAEQIATLERAALEAAQAARIEEQRRVTALQEIVHDTETALAAARDDAAAATHAAERLRQRTAELAGACRRGPDDPAAAGPGQAADPAADLLEIVQRRLDDAADGIARHADQAVAAGRACERSYDALTVRRAE